MTNVLKAVAWLPYSKALREEAKALFELHLYNDKACNRCEYLEERHCDVCDTCPAFLGHHKMWRLNKDKTKIGLCTGNRKLLKEATNNAKFRDKRAKTPMVHAIKFTAEYRGKQEEAVLTMARKGFGLLEAPPRSGKTVMGIGIACHIGYKTLILADQHEFLAQFLETVVGNKASGIKPFTNANKFGGEGTVIGMCKTLEDFEKYDICLATYQTFLSPKGQKLLRAIANLFGTVIVDEAHKVAAHCFLRVVNRLNATCRIGLTGTPDRKDKKNVLTDFVIGPPVYVMEVETLRPRVTIHETGAKLKNYKLWTYFEKALVEDANRNRLIVKMAVEDIKAGRSIVIPVTRVPHAIALAKAINKVYGESVATHFCGSQSKDQRKSIIEKARNGDILCVVGIRRLVQLGINVPRWDTLYEVMPISNVPNHTQETARVRTPMEGKKQPLIRQFIEDTPQSRGCLRTCYWGVFKPQNFQIEKRDLAIFMSYMGKGAPDVKAPKRIVF